MKRLISIVMMLCFVVAMTSSRCLADERVARKTEAAVIGTIIGIATQSWWWGILGANIFNVAAEPEDTYLNEIGLVGVIPDTVDIATFGTVVSPPAGYHPRPAYHQYQPATYQQRETFYFLAEDPRFEMYSVESTWYARDRSTGQLYVWCPGYFSEYRCKWEEGYWRHHGWGN